MVLANREYQKEDKQVKNSPIRSVDEEMKERLQPLFLDSTLEWIKNRSKEFIKLMSYYKCAMMEIETKFNVLSEEYSLEHDRNPISAVKTRLKRVESIKEKLERRSLPITIESIEQNINDVAGVRVICSFPDDVYAIADAFLAQDDIKLIQKKDYIRSPKENGYRSLHLIVSIPIFLAHEKREMKVEVQLRTIAMDFWASLEHQMRYKKDFEFTEDMERELFICAEVSAALDARMDKLRKNALREETNNE